jgi:hypothetical protein
VAPGAWDGMPIQGLRCGARGVGRVWCVARVGDSGRGDQQWVRPDHGGYLTVVGVFSCVGVGVVVSMAVRVGG